MSTLKYVIDLGSTFTTIYKLGSGVVLREPTVAAISIDGKNKLKLFGNDARKLIGKTAENTKVVFPVFEGEIVNEQVAGKLVEKFLHKVGVGSVLHEAECIFSLPCGATVEIVSKYKKVASIADIDKVHFVEAPMLSALGGRVPVSDDTPFFLVDMAGGTTNIAVLSLDGIIAGFSVNFGFSKISTDIIDYVADKYSLQIGLLTAERLKKDIGSLDEFDGLTTIVNGRDAVSGTPKAISIRACDIVEPIKKYYEKVCELALSLLSKLPPEVSAEIRHSGLYLSGEGVNIYGIEKFFEKKFDVTINLSESPEYDICIGGGILLGNKQLLKRFAIKTA